MQGIVTDIQRFSLHDGPGIRTTVFLKGCNMCCAWCHNPETLSCERQLMAYPEKCIGCGHCLSVCKTGARFLEDGVMHFDRKLCVSCGACADVCFSGALTMAGKRMTASEVMDEILQDTAYYAHSGGGVTLSGGEVFCQRGFAMEILERCRDAGIPTAVETNLNHPYAVLEEALPLIGLVMFDIKLIDGGAHAMQTGVPNPLILENARRLLASGIPAIARTPIVPGVTDDAQGIAAIAGFLSGSPSLLYWELLNFNPLGEDKYAGLGMANAFAGIRPLSTEKMLRLADIAASAGVAVRVR